MVKVGKGMYSYRVRSRYFVVAKCVGSYWAFALDIGGEYSGATFKTRRAAFQAAIAEIDTQYEYKMKAALAAFVARGNTDVED